jgi:hypothetical protein
MNSKASALLLIGFAAAAVFHLTASLYAAVLVAFILCALLTPARHWGACRLNSIDADLKLDDILSGAIEGFNQVIVPVLAFATVFRDVQLKGTNIVRVPYYPLEGAASKQFSYNDGYVFDSNTGLASRPVTIDKRPYQDLSITSEEAARQPALNATKHGQRKGRKLAYDVLQDIASLITAANFPHVAFTGAASAFDSDDVVDIRTAANSLRTGPTSVADGVTTSGSNIVSSATASFDQSDVGSAISGTGIPADTVIAGYTNVTTVTLSNDATASATGITFTMARPKIPWPEMDRSLLLTPDYDGHLFKDDAVKTAYSLGSDSVIKRGQLPDLLGFGYAQTAALPDNGENLVGVATYMSALLVAFSPIAPAPGVRQQLLEYQIVEQDGVAIEFRHFGDAQMDTDRRTIECNYGRAVGERNALMRLISA